MSVSAKILEYVENRNWYANYRILNKPFYRLNVIQGDCGATILKNIYAYFNVNKKFFYDDFLKIGYMNSFEDYSGGHLFGLRGNAMLEKALNLYSINYNCVEVPRVDEEISSKPYYDFITRKLNLILSHDNPIMVYSKDHICLIVENHPEGNIYKVANPYRPRKGHEVEYVYEYDKNTAWISASEIISNLLEHACDYDENICFYEILGIRNNSTSKSRKLLRSDTYQYIKDTIKIEKQIEKDKVKIAHAKFYLDFLSSRYERN